MTGLCPGGTGPPDCYAGPKWSSNDPMFFLHHAVSSLTPSLVSAVDAPGLDDRQTLVAMATHGTPERHLVYRRILSGSRDVRDLPNVP